MAPFPLYGEDTFSRALLDHSDEARMSPAPDPRLSPDWLVRGTLVAQDRIAGGILGSETVFYGWLLERANAAGDFMAVVRGTGDLREWLLDAEIGELKTHPVAGKVEYGFWSIYDSMRYRPAGGGNFPTADGITQAVGTGKVTVTGHSLGSALATYLAFDLGAPKRLGSRVQAVLFASPRPGDSSFAAAFNMLVPNHRAYWWENDLVPKVPFGFGYAPVPKSIELTPPAGLKVCRSITCAHHCLSYGSMLDPSLLKSFQSSAEDQRFLDCLISDITKIPETSTDSLHRGGMEEATLKSN